jgi:hypothetical protein
MQDDHNKLDAMDKRLTTLEATLPLQIQHLATAIEDFRKDMGGKLSELSLSIKEQSGFNEMFRGHVSQQANINDRVNKNTQDIAEHRKIMYIGYGIIIVLTAFLNYPQLIHLFK